MSVVSSVPCSGLTAQEGVPEWDQNNTTTLIQMYKERKCLWDTSHEFYKNRRFRREALTEMANHFNCSLADVEKKLYMLRSSFRKEYRRWNYAKLNAGPNNTFLVRKPQWFALDLLMFLKDDVAKKSVIPLNPVTTDCAQQQQVQQNQQQQQLHQHQQSQQEAHQQTQRDLDLNIPVHISRYYSIHYLLLAIFRYPFLCILFFFFLLIGNSKCFLLRQREQHFNSVGTRRSYLGL